MHDIQTIIYENITPTNKISKTADRYKHTTQKTRYMRFNEKATIEGFPVQQKIKPIHLTYFNPRNTCKYSH